MLLYTFIIALLESRIRLSLSHGARMDFTTWVLIIQNYLYGN